jgi:hypothetical protein
VSSIFQADDEGSIPFTRSTCRSNGLAAKDQGSKAEEEGDQGHNQGHSHKSAKRKATTSTRPLVHPSNRRNLDGGEALAMEPQVAMSASAAAHTPVLRQLGHDGAALRR